jgi:hypothetical protein
MSQQTTSIATDGLVFAYDMNSSRSYRGRVATNLLQYIVSDSVSVSANNNYRVSSGTEDVYIPSLGEMKGVVYTDVMNDYNNSYGGGGSGNCCPRIMRYAEGVSVSPNTTYTYSIVYKATSGYTNANYMYQYQFTSSGGSYVTEFGLHDTNKRIHLGDGWYWAWNTFTTGSNVNWIGTMGMWHYEYRTYSRVYVAKALLAQGDWTNTHPKYWPNVGTTRSNTQSLLDLTNNNTITATSLTYASNGTFNFNGSNNTLDCGNSASLAALTGTSNVTVEAWVNLSGYGSTSGYGVITHKGYPWAFLMENPSNTMRVRFYLSNSGDVSCSDSTTHALNTWYHFVGTYDGSNMRFYRNGVLTNTVAGSGTVGGGGASMVVGSYGGAYFSQGQIPNVKVYNRTLSAAEVQQNFQALRGRYGV